MPENFLENMTADELDRMYAVRRDHRTWSDETFGDVGPAGPLEHLAEEALEAKQDPNNPEEYADCMFLLWDALARQTGFSVEEFLSAMETKMATNRARGWPEPKDGAKRNHIDMTKA